MAPCKEDAFKAKNMRVYVSGLQGQVPIQVGVAYHYRGHHIYGPAFNPIVPIDFATKKEIMIAGMTKDTAPLYDPQAGKLVPEQSIAALNKAMRSEWAQPYQEPVVEADSKKGEEAFALQFAEVDSQDGRLGGTTPVIVEPDEENRCLDRPASLRSAHGFSMEAVHSRLSSQSSSLGLSRSSNPDTDHSTGLDHYFIPHDRARYLAASAPGSRHGSWHGSFANTPHNSRPVTPLHGQRAPLRQLDASTFNTRLENEEIRRATSPLEGINKNEWLDSTEMNTFVDIISRPPSRVPSPLPPSRSRSRAQHKESSPDYQEEFRSIRGVENRGLGSVTRASDLESKRNVSFPAFPTIYDSNGLLSVRNERAHMPSKSLDYSRDKPIGTGRPRKASQLLNEAYNAARPTAQALGITDLPFHSSPPPMSEKDKESGSGRVTKCALHGEECDGESVVNVHLTEEARLNRGFADLYPTITSEGRVMVDWHALLMEVKKAGPQLAA